MTYPITVAGLQRELPLCKVTDDLYIGAFICFGDAELTVACARELLKLVPEDSYDYLFTAEAKSIPLIQSRESSRMCGEYRSRHYGAVRTRRGKYRQSNCQRASADAGDIVYGQHSFLFFHLFHSVQILCCSVII